MTSSWFHAAWKAEGRPELPFGGSRTYPESGFGASVHVVRDPLSHVRALAAGLSGTGGLAVRQARVWDRRSFTFAGTLCPRVKEAYDAVGSGSGEAWRGVGASKWDDARLRLAALYYLDWNDVAAAAAPLSRFRIEDIDEYAFFAALGVEMRTTWPLKHTSLYAIEHDGASNDPMLAWGGDLRAALGDDLYGELIRRARAYGYDAQDASY